MVTCEGCHAILEAEECEMHFGRWWCPACELTLQDEYDAEYRNSDRENEDYLDAMYEAELADAEADAWHSQWDD